MDDDEEVLHAVIRMNKDPKLPAEILTYFHKKAIHNVYFVTDVLIGTEAQTAKKCGCYMEHLLGVGAPAKTQTVQSCAECARRAREKLSRVETGCQTEKQEESRLEIAQPDSQSHPTPPMRTPCMVLDMKPQLGSWSATASPSPSPALPHPPPVHPLFVKGEPPHNPPRNTDSPIVLDDEEEKGTEETPQTVAQNQKMSKKRKANPAPDSAVCQMRGCGASVLSSSFHSHAQVHFPAQFFRCSACSTLSNRRAALFSHIRAVHGQDKAKVVDLRTSDTNKKIKEMVTKCFPPKQREEEETDDMGGRYSPFQDDNDDSHDPPYVEENKTLKKSGSTSLFEKAAPSPTGPPRLYLKKTAAALTTVQCSLCAVIVRRNLTAMRTHVSSHLTMPPFYKCSHCNEQTHYESAMKQHVSTSHCGEAAVVDEGNEQMRSNVRKCIVRAFRDHLEERVAAAPPPTPVPPPTKPRPSRTPTPNTICTPSTAVSMRRCTECLGLFNSVSVARSHSICHAGVNLFMCSLCDFSTKRKKTLNVHMKNIHPEMEADVIDLRTPEVLAILDACYKRCFPVGECELVEKGDERATSGGEAKKRASATPSTIKHAVKRTKIEKDAKAPPPISDNIHDCTKCGRRYVPAATQKTHAVQHMNFRPYSCSLCSYESKHEVAVREHLLSQHGEMGDFVRLRTLIIDRWTDKRRQEQLSVMAECFPSKAKRDKMRARQQHLEKDEGWEEEELVEQQSKTKRVFAEETGGKEHKHTLQSQPLQLSPNSCMMCGVVAQGPSAKLAHTIIHMDFYPYQCPHCSYISKHLSSVRSHMTSKHGETGSKERLSELVIDMWTDERRAEQQSVLAECFPPNETRERHMREQPEKMERVEHIIPAPHPNDCKVCGERVQRARRQVHCITKHLHWTNRLFGCPYCTSTNNYEDNMTSHIKAKHGGGRVVDMKTPQMRSELDECMVRCFPVEEEAKPVHVEMSANPEKTPSHIFPRNTCTECGERVTASRQTIHCIRKHLSWTTRQFQCPHCDRQDNYTSNMDIHIRNAHGGVGTAIDLKTEQMRTELDAAMNKYFPCVEEESKQIEEEEEEEGAGLEILVEMEDQDHGAVVENVEDMLEELEELEGMEDGAGTMLMPSSGAVEDNAVQGVSVELKETHEHLILPDSEAMEEKLIEEQKQMEKEDTMKDDSSSVNERDDVEPRDNTCATTEKVDAAAETNHGEHAGVPNSEEHTPQVTAVAGVDRNEEEVEGELVIDEGSITSERVEEEPVMAGEMEEGEHSADVETQQIQQERGVISPTPCADEGTSESRVVADSQQSDKQVEKSGDGSGQGGPEKTGDATMQEEEEGDLMIDEGQEEDGDAREGEVEEESHANTLVMAKEEANEKEDGELSECDSEVLELVDELYEDEEDKEDNPPATPSSIEGEDEYMDM